MHNIERPSFVLNANGPQKQEWAFFVSKFYNFIRYTEHTLFNRKTSLYIK